MEGQTYEHQTTNTRACENMAKFGAYLVLFFLAASVTVLVGVECARNVMIAEQILGSLNVGGTETCGGVCSPFQMPPCGSTNCRCVPWGLFVGQCINPTAAAAGQ